MMQQNSNQMMNAGVMQQIDPAMQQQQQQQIQMMPQQIQNQQQNYQQTIGGAGAYMIDHNQAAAASVGVQQQQRMMRSSMNQMGAGVRPNVMMQNRGGPQGNIMVVNVPNTANMQMQQQQPIRMNETEVRVLSMLPEDDRQRLIAMSEDQRKQWIRRFMMDMQQQQSKVQQQQQQQQMMKNVPGQWNSGMGPPEMQQQQVRFMNASNMAQQQQFMQQQQRFIPQQRVQQMMMMQQQQQQPQQQTVYRMGPRTPIAAQQGYMNAQYQPAMSPGNFQQGQQPATPASMASGNAHYAVMQQQSPGAPYALVARQQQQQMQAVAMSEPSPLSMDGSSGNLPIANNMGHMAPPNQQLETSKEDSMYNEKIKELQVYLDFLKRSDKSDVHAGQVGQAKREKFIDILEGRTKVNYDILIRCERVLQAMQQQPDNKAKNFQPFLDTVVESMAKCSSNAETMSNNLKKATSCIDFYEDIPDSFKIKLISDEEYDHQEKMSKKRTSKKSTIPLALEREMAFLDRKFDIKIKKIDKEKCNKSKEFITLICNIKDPKLPIVPPLLITVYQDYPASNPNYTVDASEYNDSNAFLKSIKLKMTKNLQSPGFSSTMTSLLNNWESSVRQIKCEV